MADAKRDRSAHAERSPASDIGRRRALSERLLLAALHEHDLTAEAVETSRRAAFLASTSRDLALSLDDASTRETVRRRTLPREGSWCIVDIIELDGAAHRLAVAHPDPAKQQLAQAFANRWFPSRPETANEAGAPSAAASAPDDPETRTALRELGFGGLLVAPLVVRKTVLGAITFVTREGDPPFSPDEVTLASDLADLCALALDNARLYRESQALRQIAEEASRAKSTFLGNVSHELMTPLGAIGGYVTLIEMGLRGPVTPEQLVDLARIRHNQAHLLTLISELLTYVRSESGRLQYRMVEVSVDAALRAVADMLQGTINERQLQLVHRPDSEDVLMWADADRVRQILLNLVANAVKYGSVAGGVITLDSTATPDRVAIHVVDTGQGIPVEKLAAIFDPFVQLPGDVRDRRGGVGLGLTISRDLARAMNGDLTVESTVGGGSRFTLELPRVHRSSASTVGG